MSTLVTSPLVEEELKNSPNFAHLLTNNLHSTDQTCITYSSGSTHPSPHSYIYGGARKGAKAWQEDSFGYFISTNKIVTLGCVFDGHGGYNGLIASQCARDTTLTWCTTHNVQCESWTPQQWSTQLTQLFAYLHTSIREKFLSTNITSPTNANERRYVDEKGIVRTTNGDPVHGGTTATIVVTTRTGNTVDEKKIHIITANVGDSTAIIMPAKGKVDFLSVDHGPENTSEFDRLQQLDPLQYPLKLLFVYDKTNVFRKYECPLVFKEDGTKDTLFVNNPWGNGLHPTNVRYEPAVYAVTPRSVSKDSTCIAMTRALGDFYAHQFGLCAEPSVNIRSIGREDGEDGNCSYTILVASDGIWDCWKYEEFHTYCHDLLYKPVDPACTIQSMGEKSLDESITRAIANFGSKHYDDACLVVWNVDVGEN